MVWCLSFVFVWAGSYHTTQAGLELSSCLPFPSTRVTGVCHHAQLHRLLNFDLTWAKNRSSCFSTQSEEGKWIQMLYTLGENEASHSIKGEANIRMSQAWDIFHTRTTRLYILWGLVLPVLERLSPVLPKSSVVNQQENVHQSRQ